VITIDKGVPAPARNRPRGSPPKYPFGDMAVGDSFSWSADDSHRVRTAAAQYGRVHQIKFTCETRKENGQRVVRVWRVE